MRAVVSGVGVSKICDSGVDRTGAVTGAGGLVSIASLVSQNFDSAVTGLLALSMPFENWHCFYR